MAAELPAQRPRPEEPPERMWVSGRVLERLGLKYGELATLREGRSLQRRAQELRRQQGLPPFQIR